MKSENRQDSQQKTPKTLSAVKNPLTPPEKSAVFLHPIAQHTFCRVTVVRLLTLRPATGTAFSGASAFFPFVLSLYRQRKAFADRTTLVKCSSIYIIFCFVKIDKKYRVKMHNTFIFVSYHFPFNLSRYFCQLDLLHIFGA